VAVADDTTSMTELARRITYIFHEAAREKAASEKESPALIKDAGNEL
jgi:hypothetical protein